jgi:hypothetical protein
LTLHIVTFSMASDITLFIAVRFQVNNNFIVDCRKTTRSPFGGQYTSNIEVS